VTPHHRFGSVAVAAADGFNSGAVLVQGFIRLAHQAF
jgi:hypothetical protein